MKYEETYDKLKCRIKIWRRGYTDDDMVDVLAKVMNHKLMEIHLNPIVTVSKSQIKCMSTEQYCRVVRYLREYEQGKCPMMNLYDCFIFSAVQERMVIEFNR